MCVCVCVLIVMCTRVVQANREYHNKNLTRKAREREHLSVYLIHGVFETLAVFIAFHFFL